MGDSVQKNRREIWSQEALSTLRKAVEAQPGGDSDMDWAEVAQKLGFTVDRVRRKWSRIKNTGAVSEPLFAQLPFAQLPLSYGTNPRNPKVDNSDLVAFFNMNLQDPRPTSAELDTGDLKDRVKDEGIMRWCLGMEVIQDFTATLVDPDESLVDPDES